MTTTDILARLKSATGPDREIDAMIWRAAAADEKWVAYKAVKRPAFMSTDDWRFHDGWFVGRKTEDDFPERLEIFTASIDAALALVERMLPGWMLKLVKNPIPGWYSCLVDQNFNCSFSNYYDGEERPQDAPIAILTALFTALEAKEKVEP